MGRISKILDTVPMSGNHLTMMHGQLWEAGFGSTSQAHLANVVEISLGKDTKDIAHGLFSALRELDNRAVDVIFVEGISEEEGIAAAVMNRLRKAATVIEK